MCGAGAQPVEQHAQVPPPGVGRMIANPVGGPHHPVRILHTLLPRMAERGSGAAIIAQGSSVRAPRAALTSVSVPQSGLLNYLLSVDQQVCPRGVRVGSLQIDRLIETSAAQQLFDSAHFDAVEVGDVARVHPDVLAQESFEMATTEADVERAA
jgi:NAD(P)-dependent dehydrogenase (short-subunit alcohol dehydrogenase family)